MIPKNYLQHINSDVGNPFDSLPKRIRQEAKTWPLGGMSGRREFLEMVANRLEELERLVAASQSAKDSQHE